MVLLFCLSNNERKERICYLLFGTVMRVRYSVSQLTLGIPRKNLTYLHTKQRPPWLHVSFFNQPLTY